MSEFAQEQGFETLEPGGVEDLSGGEWGSAAEPAWQGRPSQEEWNAAQDLLATARENGSFGRRGLERPSSTSSATRSTPLAVGKRSAPGSSSRAA